MVCIVLLLAGAAAATFLRPQSVWATMRSREGVVAAQLICPGGVCGEVKVAEFDRLAAEIEEALRGL